MSIIIEKLKKERGEGEREDVQISRCKPSKSWGVIACSRGSAVNSTVIGWGGARWTDHGDPFFRDINVE